jgi:hypothetical protein
LTSAALKIELSPSNDYAKQLYAFSRDEVNFPYSHLSSSFIEVQQKHGLSTRHSWRSGDNVNAR